MGNFDLAAAYNNQLEAQTGLGLTQGTRLAVPTHFTRLLSQNKATAVSRGEEFLFTIPFTLLFIPLPFFTTDKYKQNKSFSN